MTTWIDTQEGGRARGPRGLVRAWVEVMVRPRRFFRRGIAPGDQAPGLVFAALVAVIYVGERLAFAPHPVPIAVGDPLLSGTIALVVTALIIAPVVLHLTAALQTLLLLLFMNARLDRDRAGVSETVQLLAYATAPCVFAGFPSPILRFAATAYGACLLFIGTAVVHEAYPEEVVWTGTLPALLVFGGAFGGAKAATAVGTMVAQGLGT